jgi:GAF domain-containing protein
MKSAELPDNEPERLSSLYSLNILDSDIEEEFDRFTRLAMNIFDVPIALISLVDEDRQWFKSCQGLSAQETDRDISFCGHAILQRDTFIVEDTLEDERFCDNPLVTSEPKIRFYAGQPIIYNSHYHLGTLCLIDHKPRHFTERDSQVLQDLTRLVEDEIESR